ncbi:hypothetical protein WJX73_005819 [Symbiochloris irregularis]|uniref:Uncharacterized protein n=1 Tax=Symbiochloris irregularis TaxID=706552 RepID=A0AAW1NTM6_9CHLO
MGKGLSRRRRAQNFLKSHGKGTVLPPPPNVSQKTEANYQPKSLQRLLQVKALAEGRGKSAPSQATSPKIEVDSLKAQQSAPAAPARPSEEKGSSRTVSAQVPSKPSSQRPVRAKRKEHLKARKQRLKVTKTQPDDLELDPIQPAFGEQVLAPPQIKFRTKSRK